MCYADGVLTELACVYCVCVCAPDVGGVKFKPSIYAPVETHMYALRICPTDSTDTCTHLHMRRVCRVRTLGYWLLRRRVLLD